MSLRRLLPPAPAAAAGWPADARPGLYRRPGGPGDAEVFALALPDRPDAWLEALAPEASPARRDRAARFRDPLDALRCLAAEALLRQAAKDLCDLEPGRLATTTGAQGKPRFVDLPGLHFNLSHAGLWVLCAWDVRPVGVDVEVERPLHSGLAQAALSPEESRSLQALPEDLRRAAFCRLWTLKESLLKAAGTGLGHDPRRIRIGPDHQACGEVPPAPPGCTWNLMPLALPQGAWAALCCAR